MIQSVLKMSVQNHTVGHALKLEILVVNFEPGQELCFNVAIFKIISLVHVLRHTEKIIKRSYLYF